MQGEAMRTQAVSGATTTSGRQTNTRGGNAQETKTREAARNPPKFPPEAVKESEWNPRARRRAVVGNQRSTGPAEVHRAGGGTEAQT